MNQHTQRHDVLVGLHIVNDEQYDQYRASMTPILHEHNAYFSLDLRVSQMLKGNATDPFNRVFIISFPDQKTMTRFFENETYKAIRTRHFEPAVQSATIIGTVNSTPPENPSS